MDFSHIESIRELIKTSESPLTRDTIKDHDMVKGFKAKFLASADLASEDDDLFKEIAKEFAEMIRHLSQQCDMSEAELKKIIKEHLQESN